MVFTCPISALSPITITNTSKQDLPTSNLLSYQPTNRSTNFVRKALSDKNRFLTSEHFYRIAFLRYHDYLNFYGIDVWIEVTSFHLLMNC